MQSALDYQNTESMYVRIGQRSVLAVCKKKKTETEARELIFWRNTKPHSAWKEAKSGNQKNFLLTLKITKTLKSADAVMGETESSIY
jgi:hypothetical protein